MVEIGCCTVGDECLSQLQGLLTGPKGLLGDLKFAVEGPKLEISCRHVRNQGRDDGPLAPFCCEQLRTSSLGLSPVPPPEVEIPDHRQVQLACIYLIRRKHICDLRILLTREARTYGR